MRLYDSGPSGNCYKVRLLLSHLGLPYDQVKVDVFNRENRQSLLGDKNPSARVPILEFDDGRTLGESNAILLYLAENTPYLPDGRFERARVMQWLFFEQNLHEPNIAVARYWKSLVKQADRFPEQMRAKLDGGRSALQVMERHLQSRSYLTGERYTVADISLYAYTHVAPEAGLPLDGYPSLRAWIQRIMDQPGHVSMLAGT